MTWTINFNLKKKKEKKEAQPVSVTTLEYNQLDIN